jgi:UbiD family decarboxylase
MDFPDLRAYLDALRLYGDLAVVEAEVDPHLEVAEIHRRVIAAGGPALLFTRVKGRDFPVVTNLFGTERRARLAFGSRAGKLIERLVGSIDTLLPPSPGKLWGARDLLAAAWRVGLRRSTAGPVSEVETTDVRLDRVPALTSWPEDGGPFLTLGLVYTENPEAPGPGKSNLGLYRMQVHDPRTTGMHWQIGKGGGFHHAAAEARGESLPAAVFLGGPPALMLAAVAPLPENVPELMLASLIAGRRLPLVTGKGPLPVVATAELALLGKVPPKLRAPEGPFGDHYGYYSLRHDYPVFQVEKLLRRKDAIVPATVVGKPRQEDFFIGDLLQELLSPLFPLVMPAVEALWSYGETGYHSLAAAVVKQRYAREALQSAFRILGEGQLSLTKFLLLTDRRVDLRDFKATLAHVLERTRPETDLYVLANTSMDSLDYTGPAVNLGSKGVWMGLGDAVRELPREWKPPSQPPGEVRDVRVFCPGCLVVGGPPFAEDAQLAARLPGHPAFAGWPLLVLTDEPERAAKSAINFLWTTFTRFEPAADLHAAATRVERHHIAYSAPILIDARRKPGLPKELYCDEKTGALVTRRWSEYFGARKVPMRDSGQAHLD